jgi:hypothetical protein
MRSRLTGVGVALILASVALVAPGTAGYAAEGLSASFEQQGVWPTGYLGQVTVHNPGTSAVAGWRVEFDLPDGTEITSHWLAQLDRTGGHHVFTNHGYNATVPAGGSQSFGFVATGTGTPTGCLVNGAPCDGQPPPPPPPVPPPPPPPIPPPAPDPEPPPPVPPGGRLVEVSTPAQLQAALDDAQPGDVISVARNTYHGQFRMVGKHGTAELPIVIDGSRHAVPPNLSGGAETTPGAALEIVDSSHIHVADLEIHNHLTGLVAEGVTFSRFSEIEVRDVDGGGLVLRGSSSDNVVRFVNVRRTGELDPARGAAVTIGTENGLWGGGQPDRSDRNQILSSSFIDIAAERALLIHEGSSDGVVRDVHFSGGVGGPGSWIDVRGNNHLIAESSGSNAAPNGDPETLANGFETNLTLAGWGCGNVFDMNLLELNGVAEYGVRIGLPVSACGGNPNLVYDNNHVEDAVVGVSNVPLTPAPPGA